MKIRADEHVSPEIVNIINNILVTDSAVEVSSVLAAGHKGSDDAYWITKFAEEGGTAILSADTDFFKKPHQVVAVDNTGIRVIHLPTQWANARGHMQAAHILMWWERILRQIDLARPREVWIAPWNISETGDLKRKKVDYGFYRKKLRKMRRRQA